jgi:hypothetical protein
MRNLPLRALGIAFLALVASVLGVRSASATPIVIDDFETGGFSTILDSTTGDGPESGNQTGSMLGGSRSVDVEAWAGQAAATLSLTGADDGISFGLSANGEGRVYLEWDLLTPVDITAAGTLDRIEVVLTTPSAPVGQISLSLHSPGYGGTIGLPITGPSTYTWMFSSFSALAGVDPTNIDLIGIELWDGVDPAARNYVISGIQVVPEPTTALLLGGGLLGVAARGRCRRA